MGIEYIAAKLSDDEIRRIARKTLAYYKPRPAYPINIVAILQRGSVPTLTGAMQLRYQTVPDCDLDEYAITDFREGERIITARQSVHDLAQFGDGRSRMTLAHELAHAVLHTGAPKARGLVTQKLSFVKPFESAERQANVFGSGFLIDDARAAALNEADEVAVEFCVSREAALICLERLNERARRQEMARKLRELSADIAASSRPPSKAQQYADACCPRCGTKTLLAIGCKFLCTTCDAVSDSFQDGDPYP